MIDKGVYMTFEKTFAEGTAGRHETFFPRYGWLKKGYDRCRENPHIFNDAAAIEQLGVGKNMVRSIRFWSLLFGIIEPGEKNAHFRPTEFGDSLLNEGKGWDPYLEDPASLWLLHWQIFRPPFTAVSWNLAFSYVTLSAFTIHELSEAISTKFQEFNPPKRISQGSFQRDAACMVHMYAKRRTKKSDIDSPFSELKLLVHAPEEEKSNTYRFSQENKRNLPDRVFLSAVLDYASIWYPDQNSLSLSQISYGPNSPGMAFRLSETDCGSRLERVCRESQDLIFTETNGIRQVQFSKEPGVLSEKYLQSYYGERR